MITLAVIAATCVLACACVAALTVDRMHVRSIEHERQRFRAEDVATLADAVELYQRSVDTALTEVDERVAECETAVDEAVSRVRKAGLGEGLAGRRARR